MMRGTSTRVLAMAVALLLAIAATVSAQITTGTVAGTVKDAQGGVIPGATVTLISEARGTKSSPVVTNSTGDYVIPNVTADTYTIEVTMSGFKTTQRTGVVVTGGDRVAVTAITIQPGGQTEVVNVTAEAPLIQAQSGERSFAVSNAQIENLPVNRGNFTNFTAMVPGVVSGGASAGGTRLGGASQNNIQMDGISAMDTGNNGQMLNMNIESIAEVKVLTQAYQAEYGRSSGLQITAVTKGGSNRFHGSLYRVDTSSKWNANSFVNVKNGDPKTVARNTIEGYSIGGPVGKPGGSNKLFFFYSHEYRPSTTSGTLNRFRVPTALERVGDFSQSLDNNGKAIPQLKNPAGGTFAGNIITSPADPVGLAILQRYPLPNLTQAAGTSYNLEIPRPGDTNLTQQPAVRIDYQFSPSLRVTGKYSGERQKQRVVQGTIPGFNDVLVPYPYITNYGITVNYTLNSTTFFEATYGSIKNELAGGGSGGIPVNPASSINSIPGLAATLPFPDAGVVNPGYYQMTALQRLSPVWFDGTRVTLPPNFAWGGLIGGAPPNVTYPGWLNVNKTQDFAASLTKVQGRHTLKGGFYNNHSFKAQNTGAGGIANLGFLGYIDFGNNTTNPLDTGYGYSNAYLGVYTEYLQASKLIEGNMIYNNTEFYLQDNWKVNSRLTLDYGLRFTHQQPQYDTFEQMTNFFPDQWTQANAPLLYLPGCNNGSATCSGNALNAKNPVTGQVLSVAGFSNTQAFIGTPVPNTGSITNGIQVAGQGISKYGYTWPSMVYGPRFGAAYDLTGTQSMVLRGGGGVFYDRPDGNTVFSIPGNPPIATSTDLRNSTLANTGSGKGTPIGAVPALSIFQYDAQIPTSVQWNGGVQMALPWSSSLDVSYVGNHGINRMGAFQGGTTVNINAIDIGSAYLPQNQNPTLTSLSSTPGANAYSQTNLLRPFQGLSTIARQETQFYDTYHSIQTSFNRRFRSGFQFGVNYTLGLEWVGNTGLPGGERLIHPSPGVVQVAPDEAQYEALMKNLDNRRHTLRANWVWDLPDIKSENSTLRAVGYVVNDWQLSGVLTAGSNPHYDLSYSYNTNGSNQNITGSPDYAGRVVFTGDPGSGCSSNQFQQFSAGAVTGPQYYSNAMESGRNVMLSCPDHTVDLAIVRNIRLGGGRQVQLRLDAFNAFNVAVISARQSQIQLNSPTDLTLRNSETLADGSIDPTKMQPKSAGFGATTNWQTARNLQLTARFSF